MKKLIPFFALLAFATSGCDKETPPPKESYALSVDAYVLYFSYDGTPVEKMLSTSGSSTYEWTTGEFQITSNVAWHLSAQSILSDMWFGVSQREGKGDTAIKVTATGINRGDTDLQGYVSIYADDPYIRIMPRNIHVIQYCESNSP